MSESEDDVPLAKRAPAVKKEPTVKAGTAISMSRPLLCLDLADACELDLPLAF